MKLFTCCLFLTLSLLLSYASCSRESHISAHWSVGSLSSDVLHRVTVALKQQNIDTLTDFINHAADPYDKKYGRWMSQDDLVKLIAPPSDVYADALAFFQKRGAMVDEVMTRDFLSVTAPLSTLSEMFECDFRVYRHQFSGREIVRCPSHRMPAELSDAVHIISGLSDFFDTKAERKLAKLNAKRSPQLIQDCTNSAPDFGKMQGGSADLSPTVIVYCSNGAMTLTPQAPCSDFPPQVQSITLRIIFRAHNPVVLQQDVKDLECFLDAHNRTACRFERVDFYPYAHARIDAQVTYADDSQSKLAVYGLGYAPSTYVTPSVIYEYYNVPLNIKGTNPNNSQAVTAFEEQYINVQGDLSHFFQNMGLPFQAPLIDGQNDPTQPGGESTLDIQYIMGVAPGVPSTFMSITGPGPAKPPGNGAYILEWAMHVSNLTNPPLVTSISYGDTEDGYFKKFGDFSYIERTEIELKKMASLGLTVLAGSGDAGASNVGEQGNDISDTDPTCTPFRPFYPSNSPYVTSVSSTFLTSHSLPVCQINLLDTLPVVCDQVGEVAVGVSQGLYWTTGGGFSNRSDNLQTPWQAQVVQQYLNTVNLPPTDYWNPAGRAYPDVATIGHNLLLEWNFNLTTVDGTSASGPVMAGLVSLWNDARLNAGLTPLGWINPILYSIAEYMPQSFHDITVGHNADGDIQPKCSPYPSSCGDGFRTAPGWDPVTGLGSPNWGLIRDILLQPSQLRKWKTKQLKQKKNH